MHGTRKRHEPSEMHIKRSANGGFIVRHQYDNSGAGESYQLPTEHVFKSHGEMMGHVKSYYGGAPPEAPTQRPVATRAMGRAAARGRGRGLD